MNNIWPVIPIAFVIVFAVVGASLAVKLSDIQEKKRAEKWKKLRLQQSPLCKDKSCESQEHCGTHNCHCDRQLTVNCHCAECGCPYWVPGM